MNQKQEGELDKQWQQKEVEIPKKKKRKEHVTTI